MDHGLLVAGGIIGEAIAGFFPQVSANLYHVQQNMSPNIYTSAGGTMATNFQLFQSYRNQDANFTVMYPIFSGGKTYYGYKAAAARAESGRIMLEGSRVEVAMQARLDYLTALREAENVRVTSELLRQAEERLRVARELFEAGRTARVTVLREEAERANMVQMNTMAQNNAALAVIALKTTLGVALDSPIEPAERLEFRPLRVDLEEGVRTATALHPEYLAAGKQADAAGAEVRSAWGSYLPQVSLAFMYDWNRAAARGESFGPTADGYSAGVVMTLPLFDGLMRENAIVTARARREKAQQAAALIRQRIAKEVHQAALMLATAEKNVETSRRGLEYAEEEYRIQVERFESGRGIQVELLDAGAALARARFNVVAALSDHASATAMWLKATGRVR
ncbi:MAG: TolC family protein [Deltaproteobacteria bacterium]|nr:TolC family protein [Deltaproteobacteria bacterium]